MNDLILSVVVSCTLLISATFTASQSPPNDRVEAKTIKLSTIVSNLRQKELTDIATVAKNRELLQRLLNQEHAGTTNVFVVKARNLDDAIFATVEVLLGGKSIDTPPEPAEPTSRDPDSHWLVVRLGGGTVSPPPYEFVSVEVKNNTISATYQHRHTFLASMGTCIYFAWVPVGVLQAGDWQVELREPNRNLPIMTRSLTVPLAPRK